MPKCPTCNKEVYFAEKVSSLGKDWHRACLKCAKCNKTLTSGSHAEHEGKPYCNKPCYSALFGPGAEKVSSLGKDWHRACLKCAKCNKTLTAGSHAEHDGKPYCSIPCYSALFGPGGTGRSGAQSYQYDK